MDSLPDFRRGDRLMASHMAEIVRRLNRLEGVKGSGRLQTRRGPGGSLQVAYVEGVTSSLGMANGAITARSGTTFGTGTVTFYYNVGGTATATGQSESVLNPGIAITSGKYVWVDQDMAGDWYVAPLECS
jgi:hypothetical protein